MNDKKLERCFDILRETILSECKNMIQVECDKSKLDKRHGWCCEAMAEFAIRIWLEEYKKNEQGGFHNGYFFCGYRMVYCPFCGIKI